MKALKFIKNRYLELFIVGILVTKLALTLFPVVTEKAETVESINKVANSFVIPDALAKENDPGKASDNKTLLASNDSSEEGNLDASYLKSIEPGSAETDVDLEKIKEELVKREALIKEREKKLEALRASVEKEINHLVAIQNEIKANLEKQVKERQAKSKYLAKMYSSMKPKNAAKLMLELDESLAVDVLKLMKPEKAGQVLSYLDAKKAARLTRQFYYK